MLEIRISLDFPLHFKFNLGSKVSTLSFQLRVESFDPKFKVETIFAFKVENAFA